jgi:hypothetical protein
MQTCPSCGAKSIPLAEAWGSSAGFPVRCKACDALSFVQSSASGVAVLGACALLALCGFAASFYQTGWILAGGGILAFWFYEWSWRRVPLTPTGTSSARSAKRAGLIGNIVVIIGFFSQ